MNFKEKEQSLSLAEYYFRNNNYPFAKSILDEVIKVDLCNSKANELLAYIYANSGELDVAFRLLTVACNEHDCSPEALYYLGSMQLKRSLFTKAIYSFKKSILKGGEFFEALHDLATAQAHIGEFASSFHNYQKCLIFGKASYQLFFNIARTLDDLKRYDEALAHYDKALSLKPDYADAWSNKGVTLNDLKRYDEALAHFDKALSLKPDYADAWSNKGVTLNDLKRYDEALAHFDKALSLKPDYADAWSNKGVTLNDLKRYDEALAHYDKALSLRPDYADAWSNKGVTLNDLKRYDEALAHYDKALSLRPDYAEAWSNKGVTLNDLKRYDEALAHYDKALSLRPDYAEAWSNKGVTLNDLKRYDEALAHYDKALSLKPDIDWVLGYWLHLKMKICNWSDLKKYFDLTSEKLIEGKRVISPFALLSLTDDGLLHKKSSEIYVCSKYPFNSALGPILKRPEGKKIRVGYFSADFRNHPVSLLTAELFELHDKDRFEIIAFSFGAEDGSEIRARLNKAFHRFIDVSHMSDVGIVKLARSLHIDIAVDLTGHTQGARTAIFAYRAAPIQVNWLGYPGTIGADYIDYIIADRTIIAEHHQWYVEKVVCLPDTYIVDDSKRISSSRMFTREECGLPKNDFVFCCFNNDYKFNLEVLNGWSRILAQVKNSVLWLPENNQDFKVNITSEFKIRGINTRRLIFAKRVELMADHLSRYQLADLFLDTHPYNAHTTALDSLKMGVPVLTTIGETFSSRVAASLLNAVGLPELITSSQEEYEALAIELANNTQRLEFIKQKLKNNRFIAPLFDTPRFTKNLEIAYIKMYENYQAGIRPNDIFI